VLHTISPDDALLQNPTIAIVAGELTAMLNRFGTNGQPPRGRLVVHRLLRGSGLGDTIEAVWKPLDGPEDHTEWRQGDGTEPSEYYMRPLKPEWYTKGLVAPPLGQEFIAFCVMSGRWSREFAGVVKVIDYTEENVDLVLAHMAPGEFHPRLQVLLALAVLFLGVCSIAFSGFSLVPFRTSRVRKLLLGLSAAFSLLTFGAYFIYELGISYAANIRTDLLLIYPLLLLCGLLLLMNGSRMVAMFMGRRK
jgi:hypothetical protein